jgi:hypothetical protein
VELVRLIKAANLSLIFGLAILTLEFVEETVTGQNIGF